MADAGAEVSRMIRTLVTKHGCRARVMKSGHWRISRSGYRSISVSTSPGGGRALGNIRSEIKRHLGVEL